MHAIEQQEALQSRLEEMVPVLRPPAALVRRLAEALAGEAVELACTDVRSLGFGAYEGQVCLVTATRVVLATATAVAEPERAFVLEQWERQVARSPRLTSLRPREPLPEEA